MSQFSPGTSVKGGRYTIQSLIRTGTAKSVYLASDTFMEREVALAVIENDRLTPAGIPESEWEARVLGRLGGHPNVVTVFDRWEDDGVAWMTSEYLSGGDLGALIGEHHGSDRRVGLIEVLRLTGEVAAGLDYVHRSGIVHRDIQPRNVLLDEWQTAHVADFDLAAAVDEIAPDDLASRTTVEYMAPEIARGERGGVRADLYSLGVLMYEMLAGVQPFTGATPEDIVAQHLESEPPSLTSLEPRIPRALVDLTGSLLAKAPSGRPATAKHLTDELREIARQLQSRGKDHLGDLIRQGEHDRLEFKASFRTPVGDGPSWDQLTKRERKELAGALEREVTGAIASFLNTRGGTLLVGVGDGGELLGIEPDLGTLSANSMDGWRLAFDSALSRDIGADAVSNVSLEITDVDGVRVATIVCESRDQPTFHNGSLIVRRGASSVALTTQEAFAFERDRWG